MFFSAQDGARNSMFRASFRDHLDRVHSFGKAELRAPFWRPQDAPKTHQDAPKTPQNASKTPPRRPKTLPRRPKDAPRRPQYTPKRPQEPRKTGQDAPKMEEKTRSKNKAILDTPEERKTFILLRKNHYF